MSLRLKLLLGITISIAAILMPFWWIAETNITDSIEAAYQNRAATTLHVLQASFDHSGKFDLKNIQRQVDMLKNADPDIVRIHFYTKQDTGKDNKIVISATTGDKKINGDIDKSDAIPFATGKRQITKKQNGLIEIHEPLIVKGEVAAVVGAYFKSPFGIRLWRQILFVLAGSLSWLAIAYVILNRMIISPIKHLEQATASVAQGILPAQIETKRRDEFGSLADRFNEMLTALQDQDKQNKDLQTRLQHSFNQAQVEANTDMLTQLFNRRHLEKQLKGAVSQSLTHGLSLACAFCDLDGFKDYNDVYGHQKGDEALKTVGLIIKACLRETDTAARYGGEEFALVLRETDIDGARAVSDRIRRAVANFAGEHVDGKPALTISIGIALLNSPDQTGDSLLHQADQAMYEAKNQGKNCIAIFDEKKHAYPA